MGTTRTLPMAVGLVMAAIACPAASPALAEDFRVADQAAFRQAVRKAAPGDTIILANGEWRNFQIVFEGRGLPDKPVTLTAETKGKVVLTGQSNLRLAGEHLVVSGLVFRDGYTPTDEVISFRRASDKLASHSRVTEVVIDHFNQPDRRREDRWVSLYGHDNRVDHSHFEGKENAGVTLAVIRRAGQPLDNRHRIDHNYFGPRPPLGSNGGETIRVGTSEESLSDSRTIIERNFFDRCDGEVEIVSIKSGGNIVRHNTFFESQGSLVLRHGNGNLVEGNVFLGNGRDSTGGIRVINKGQAVRGNYLEGISGRNFTSAIAVMNGVPNSAINRYHQVRDAVIERNSIVDASFLTLGAGADAERSAPPVNSRFERNLIVNANGQDPFRVETDIGGIAFAGNVQTPVPSPGIGKGVTHRPVALERAVNGLLYPTDPALRDVGAPRDLKPVTRDEVGTRWYAKPARVKAAFGSGPRTAVAAGQQDALRAAVAKAQEGGTIDLAPGMYTVAEPLVIDRVLTISGQGKAVLRAAAPTLFQLENGASLRLDGVTVTGEGAPRRAGNAVIRASARPMTRNYTVEIAGSRFAGLDGAPGFDVIATTPATLGDRIIIRNSRFENISGTVVAAAAETGDKGLYSAEAVEIADSDFSNVGQVAHLLRRGRDESTFGPRFRLTGSRISGSGTAAGAAVSLSGVQVTEITNNEFRNSGGVEIEHSVGEPLTRVTDNRFIATPMPVVRELVARGAPRAVLANNGGDAAK